MKKKTILAAAMACAMTLSLAACGSTANQELTVEQSSVTSAAAENDTSVIGDVPVSSTETAESVQTENDNTETATDQDSLKLVYTAYATLESQDFDSTVETLKNAVEENGGYFSSSSLDRGSLYYSDSYTRTASYTIRIPSENYSSFTDGLNSIAHEVSFSETVDDIGQDYYQTEVHLKTLNAEHDRLLELMEQTTDTESLISIEQALADCEYEIELYSSDLERYDDLVDYSTVYITLEEVLTLTENSPEPQSYGERIGYHFSNGLSSFLSGLSSLFLWIVGHIFQLLIAAVIIVILAVLALRRRKRKAGTQNPSSKGHMRKPTHDVRDLENKDSAKASPSYGLKDDEPLGSESKHQDSVSDEKKDNEKHTP